MAKKQGQPKRDVRETALAISHCSQELGAVAEMLKDASADDYLIEELSIMVGVRVKLAYNIKKLKKLTGQEDPDDKDRAF